MNLYFQNPFLFMFLMSNTYLKDLRVMCVMYESKYLFFFSSSPIMSLWPFVALNDRCMHCFSFIYFLSIMLNLTIHKMKTCLWNINYYYVPIKAFSLLVSVLHLWVSPITIEITRSPNIKKKTKKNHLIKDNMLITLYV